MLVAPESRGPDASCSELALPLPQPGEEEDGGIRGAVVLDRRGHTEGTGVSMDGVGGVVRVGRGPGASRGPFNCDKVRVSSTKTKKETEHISNTVQIPEEINNFIVQKVHNSNNKVFYY